MTEETYLVLRLTPQKESQFNPLGTFNKSNDFLSGKPSSASPANDFKIDSVELKAHEIQDLRRDKTVTDIVRPIPIALIAPVAASGPAAVPTAQEGATWGVQVTGALQSTYTGNGVTIAILDTGIDATHEAFNGIELVQKDFTGEGDGDQNGHGTHVAGTIFGQTVNGLRYSIAPGVRRALIGKVIGNQKSASTKEIIDAIQWAVEGGAHVINMSLGFDFPGLVRWWTENQGMAVDLATSKALAEYRDNVRFFDRLMGLLQARAAQFNSALVVAASGNESKRQIAANYCIEVAPPAAADGILSVAALQTAGPPHQSLSVAAFSNIRPLVAAPGVDIYSARAGGGYTSMNGTSMASPHVTGVAALWAEQQLQRTGTVNSNTLNAKLIGNADLNLITTQSFQDVGNGLVKAP